MNEQVKNGLVQAGVLVRKASGVVLMSGALAGSAMADTTFDTTTVVAAITAAAAAIGVIGAAVFAGPKIAVRAWKWLASAL